MNGLEIDRKRQTERLRDEYRSENRDRKRAREISFLTLSLSKNGKEYRGRERE